MLNNQTGNRIIAKNTLFLYIRMIIVLFITIYTSRVILSSLGVVDYGIYNIVAGFVTMFAFLNSSLTACIQRYFNYENSKHGDDGFHKVYITSLVIQVLLAVVVALILETFGLWYLNHKLVIPQLRLPAANTLFHASVVSLVLLIIQVPYSAAVMAKEKMDYYAIVGIVDVMLKLFIAALLPYIPQDKLEAYALLLMFVALINFIMYFAYARTRINGIVFNIKEFSFSLFQSMLKFTSWSVLGSFSQILKNQGVNILLNLYFGPVVNAARGISFQVKSALVSFMSSIVTAARPQIVESYASGNTNRANILFFTISKVSFIFMYMMALPIIYEINYVLHLWLGSNVPEFTQEFTKIILLIALVDVLNWPVSIIIYASGKISAYNIFTSIIGLLIIPIAYLALELGATAEMIYIISFIISCLVQLASILILKTTVKITFAEYMKAVILPCSYIVLSTFLIPNFIQYLMPIESFVRMVVVVISSSITIITFSYYICLNVSERQIAMSYIRKVLKK